MKRGYFYRILAISLAFLLLGCAILIPLGKDESTRIGLFIALGVILAAYIGSLVWSLVDYGRKQKKKSGD